MDVLGDLVARDRRSDRPALSVAASGRTHSYRDVCVLAAKAGNFLSHLGVGAGRGVDVDADPAVPPLATFFGAALLGAWTRFGPESDGEARAVVIPHGRESAFDPPPGSRLLVYGGSPSSPSTAHWERDVWSENPAFPPVDVDSAAPALRAGGATYAHRNLLDAARVAADVLAADDRVVLRAPLSDPRAVAAGVLAPLSVGGHVVLPDAETSGDVAVAGHDAPEPQTVRLSDVPL